MIFRKSGKRKLPTIFGITVGALAVVGFMSIKNRGKEMMSSAACKIKHMFHKKNNCEYTAGSCE